jgi:hypothetical protein
MRWWLVVPVAVWLVSGAAIPIVWLLSSLIDRKEEPAEAVPSEQ